VPPPVTGGKVEVGAVVGVVPVGIVVAVVSQGLQAVSNSPLIRHKTVSIQNAFFMLTSVKTAYNYYGTNKAAMHNNGQYLKFPAASTYNLKQTSESKEKNG
jgi:hypothetical protein